MLHRCQWGGRGEILCVSGVEEERFFASVGWKTRTTLLLKNSEEEKRKDSVELNRARLVLQLLRRRGGAYRLGTVEGLVDDGLPGLVGKHNLAN